ncbi:MAG: Ig-like domain-containing domain, partial [Bacteroidota bacterium]|nr:Ig-like domain-containing domain [Bacteroidota bacterium]
MKILYSISLISALLLTCACANTGTPGGGPKDVTPPTLLKTEPQENQTNYSKKRVTLYFDELVSLDNPAQKVIISPPQKIPPITKAIANKISVLFEDSLKDETTYTIDFTDAIVDYNEKNKFGDYAFSFSTGAVVDSFRISGVLLDASNLNPISGVIVGVHEDLNDSAFTTKALTRISKTNQNGFFSIKGLPKKPFRVFALGDKNRDYLFDQPGEPIAFYDSIVAPWTEPCQRPDTIWKDTVTVDTIIMRKITCFKPDNVLLRYFTEDFGRQYLAKRERPSREQIGLTFGYKSKTLPKLTLLNSNAQNWFISEVNPSRDSLRYWITDSSVIKMDTLLIQLDYLKTDSANLLSPRTDTLKLISRTQHLAAKSPNAKKSKKDDANKSIPVVHLDARINLPAKLDVNAVPVIEWEAPVRTTYGDPWHLYKTKDTTWIRVPFKIDKDTTFLRRYNLIAKWEFGGEYKLDLDSGKIESLYGRTNDKVSMTFR